MPASGPGRRGTRKRIQILEAAERMFATAPYDEVQAASIAAAAGVATGLPFHYFASKRGLYLATLRWVAEQQALGVSQPRGSRSARLRSYLEGHIRFIESHRETFLGLMRGGLAGDGEVRAILEEMRARCLPSLLDTLAIDAVPTSPRLRLVLRGYFGFVDEASVEWLETGGLSRAAFARLLADQLVATLATVADEHPSIARALRELPVDHE